MTRDVLREDRFDRQLREFLAWHAADVDSAPTAAAVAVRLRTRSERSAVSLLTPAALWLLAALVLAAVAGAVVVGAILLRHEPHRPAGYAAVFVGYDEGQKELIVTGIDSAGTQNQIARFGGRVFQPEGAALSPNGLLAVRALENDHLVWHIFDLHQPTAPPVVVNGIVQDYDGPRSGGTGDSGPDVFWGPGDQFAIPWNAATDGSLDARLAFVDGRTGTFQSVPVPRGRLGLRRYWAADGSGVLLGSGLAASDLAALPPQA